MECSCVMIPRKIVRFHPIPFSKNLHVLIWRPGIKNLSVPSSRSDSQPRKLPPYAWYDFLSFTNRLFNVKKLLASG